MQIGVSSYSFKRLVEKGVLTQKELISKAKEMGFDCIEYAGLNVPEGENIKDVAAELREESERVGLPIVSYTIPGNLMTGCDGNLQKEIERLQGEVDVAEILGAKSMRHDTSWGAFPDDWNTVKTFDAALPRIVEGCRAVTEYAYAKGIRTMTENHGKFCQESVRMERIYNGVNHPNFGLLIDIGNFICADEPSELAVGRLKDYAFHVHAKDFFWKSGQGIAPGEGWCQTRAGNWWRGTIVGHGVIPVAQCVSILVKNGYDGVMSIEFEGWEDVLDAIAKGRDNLIRFIEMAK